MSAFKQVILKLKKHSGDILLAGDNLVFRITVAGFVEQLQKSGEISGLTVHDFDSYQDAARTTRVTVYNPSIIHKLYSPGEEHTGPNGAIRLAEEIASLRGVLQKNDRQKKGVYDSIFFITNSQDDLQHAREEGINNRYSTEGHLRIREKGLYDLLHDLNRYLVKYYGTNHSKARKTA